MAYKLKVFKEIDNSNESIAWAISHVYYNIILSLIYGTTIYYLALPSSIITASAISFITTFAASCAVFTMIVNSVSGNSEYFVNRYKDSIEMLKLHYANHIDDLPRYLAIFACSIFVTGLVSLVIKEFFQDTAGRLLSLSYLSKPIIFSAVIMLSLFIVYLAVKPAYQTTPAASNEATDVHSLSYFGSFIAITITQTVVTMSIGYLFSIFYSGIIPNFSFFNYTTNTSVAIIFGLVGLFATTFAYVVSSNKINIAANFQTFICNVFKPFNENSCRRLISTVKIVIKNSFWAIAYGLVGFICIYNVGINQFPLSWSIPQLVTRLSASEFLMALQTVIYVSLAVQFVLSLFEAAFTKHDFDNYTPVFGVEQQSFPINTDTININGNQFIKEPAPLQTQQANAGLNTI